MVQGRRSLVLGLVLMAGIQPTPAAAASGSADAYETAVREAGSAFRAGDTHASLRHIERALDVRPNGVGALIVLSQIHLSLGRHQETAAVLERLIGIVGPNTPLALDALTLQAYALSHAERYVEAVDRLESVLAKAPDRPMTNLLLGRIHLQLGQCRAALTTFRMELELPVDRPQLSRLVARWPSSSAYEGLGLAAYQCGDTRLASESLARVPDSELSVEGRQHLGLLLAHEGRHWDAVRVFLKVLSVEETHRGALLGLMRSAAAAGLEPMEKEATDRLDSLGKEDEARRAARVRAGDLQTLAVRRLADGDRAAAARALVEAAELTHDPFALSLIARHQHDMGDPSGAEQTTRRILASDPFHADAHATMGIIQRDRADLASAAASFERATRLVPTDMSFRIRLAGTYLALGRTNDAIEQLGQARALEDAVTPRADLTGLGVTGPDVVDAAIAAARVDARRAGGHQPEFERILMAIDQDLDLRRRATTLSSLGSTPATTF